MSLTALIIIGIVVIDVIICYANYKFVHRDVETGDMLINEEGKLVDMSIKENILNHEIN